MLSFNLLVESGLLAFELFVFLNRYKKELGVKFQTIAADISKMKDKIIIMPVSPIYAFSNEFNSKPLIPVCNG
jgi:hypothetical protein